MTKASSHSKSASKLLLLLFLGTFCAQVFSVRVASTSASLSSSSLSSNSYATGYTLSSVFPAALNWGCVNLETVADAYASAYTSALTYASDASTTTKSIIETTVSGIIQGLVTLAAGDAAESNACLGNFAGSYITSDIDECSAMLLPDSSEYSVMSFNVPIPAGVCSSAPDMTMASFCLAIGKYGNLPSISIQANSGTLSCLSTAATGGVGYALSTAIEAGLDQVSLGVSLTSSFVKSTTIYTGSVESVQISGNYYDYLSLEIDPEKFSLPDIFEITGSATRVVKVTDSAETWISKLSTASNVKDVATTLFGDISMLAALELDLNVALSSKTGGLLPDLGPYEMGTATLYATTSTSTLESGQTLKPGVYTYVAANNILPSLMSTIASSVIEKVSGVLDTILSDLGISVSKIISNLAPTKSGSSNAFGFLVNTEEISLYVQTFLGPIDIIAPSGTTVSVQCYFKYNNNKFSCKFNLGAITKFFTGLVSDAVWVIKKADAFFDEAGTTIAFAEKQLAAFTNKALQTTANNIKSGATKVTGYATDAAAWAEKAIYQCGYQTFTDAVKCGADIVTDAAKCGTDYITDAAKCGADMVTDAAKCGTTWVTDAAICGYETVTDAAKCGTDFVENAAICGTETITNALKCGTDTIKNCIKNIFKGKFSCSTSQKAKTCTVSKSCNVPKTCKITASCNAPKTCSIAKSCNWPKTCSVAKTCNIANNC